MKVLKIAVLIIVVWNIFAAGSALLLDLVDPYYAVQQKENELTVFEEIVPNVKLLKTPFAGVWSGVVLIKGKENIAKSAKYKGCKYWSTKAYEKHIGQLFFRYIFK